MEKKEKNYLEYLAELYPTIAKASTEIINLQSIINLPKGTEHFMSDIHGEYEAFSHVLKNGSGAVRRKVDDVFGNTMSSRTKQALATLIYYPKEKMDRIKREEDNMEDWYKITLYRLIEISKRAASKYTRSKVRKSLPADFAYVIEELITEKADITDKGSYYNAIVNTIIRIGRAEEFIIALSELIQRLTVDHLHIVGDIYDRGPGPHVIMDKLIDHHSVDIQWGNHDVLWMGAAAGQRGCIANVIRICARYGNLDILEDGYGINLLPLATFALNTYKDDPCSCFQLKGDSGHGNNEMLIDIKMHKAISVIQFKVEGQIIKKNPEFKMGDRNLLHHIDYEKGTIEIGGKTYEMLDKSFPTVDPKDPYALTKEEEDIMERLEQAFLNCEKLQRHVRFLYAKGSLYKIYNGNLLYHGCMPMNEDGSFTSVEIYGKEYRGKALYDILEHYARRGYYAKEEEERIAGQDIMWYIWTGRGSPVFGKDKMSTFERYFLEEKETHQERKNSYYQLLEKEETVDHILKEFGLHGQDSHIVNGHVPVEQIHGESPIKCGGKLLIIDGGFSKAYQKKTGIAGYTLVCNSRGMHLAAHEPFQSARDVIENESDLFSHSIQVETFTRRKFVADTDIGGQIREQIHCLEELLEADRTGAIMES